MMSCTLCFRATWYAVMYVRHCATSSHVQDIGFDGIAPYVGFDNTVINTYFDVYFPKAVRRRGHLSVCLSDACAQIRVAEELRQRGGPEALRFMTHVRRQAIHNHPSCFSHRRTSSPSILTAHQAWVSTAPMTMRVLLFKTPSPGAIFIGTRFHTTHRS